MVLGIRYHMVSIPAYNYPSTSTFERNMVDGFNGFNDFSRQAPVSIPPWAATRGLVFGWGGAGVPPELARGFFELD